MNEMRYEIEFDHPDEPNPWVVRDHSVNREVDRFFDRKAAELFANAMNSRYEDEPVPADAGWHDDERTDGATGTWKVNGDLMEKAAAVLRTANALGVCPVELARSLHGALAANRGTVTA